MHWCILLCKASTFIGKWVWHTAIQYQKILYCEGLSPFANAFSRITKVDHSRNFSCYTVVVSCPDPNHFVEYGLVTYTRFLGLLPYFIVGHLPRCSLLNHGIPGSSCLIGQKGKWRREQNSSKCHQTLLNKVGGV